MKNRALILMGVIGAIAVGSVIAETWKDGIAQTGAGAADQADVDVNTAAIVANSNSIDAIEGKTNLWNQASVDAISATDSVVQVQSRTQTWEQASVDATTAIGSNAINRAAIGSNTTASATAISSNGINRTVIDSNTTSSATAISSNAINRTAIEILNTNVISFSSINATNGTIWLTPLMASNTFLRFDTQCDSGTYVGNVVERNPTNLTSSFTEIAGPFTWSITNVQNVVSVGVGGGHWLGIDITNTASGSSNLLFTAVGTNPNL